VITGTAGMNINGNDYAMDALDKLKEVRLERRDTDYIYLKTNLPQLAVKLL
jgi:hypothetical protein